MLPLLLTITALIAFNVVAGYAERPWLPLLTKWVPATDGKPAQRALHVGVGVLYALASALGCLYAIPQPSGNWLLFAALTALLRAAIFEPVLINGRPGEVWGYVGSGSSWYDRKRRELAERLGWPVRKVGAWSNVLAAILAAACFGWLLLLK